MPIQYVIHPQCRLVVTTGEGRITFAEVRAHQDRLLADPSFSAEFNQLLDATRTTDFALSADEIRAVLARKLFSPTSRRAFIVNSTYLYGISRMLGTYYEMSKNASPMTTFRDRASALKWLGIPEDSSLY